MRLRQHIFLSDADQIQCVHNYHSGPAIELSPHGETPDVSIHLSLDRLRRLADVCRVYLAAHDLEDDDTVEFDTRDIMLPAEAVTDMDMDLDMAIGERNCPEMVP